MQVLRKKQRRKREIELLSEQKVKILFNERNQLKQKIETEPECRKGNQMVRSIIRAK